jgi:hypothetical protein
VVHSGSPGQVRSLCFAGISSSRIVSERANDFSTTLQKDHVIAGSDEEFEMMQRQLRFMRDAVKNLPREDLEFFGPSIAECEGVFAELQARFAALKQEISDQEAREEEEEEQPLDTWTFCGQPGYTLERTIGGVRDKKAQEPSKAATEEDSGEKAIVESDDEFEIMQDDLGGMRDAVEMMPAGDGEFYGECVAECQGVFPELQARFAAVK